MNADIKNYMKYRDALANKLNDYANPIINTYHGQNMLKQVIDYDFRLSLPKAVKFGFLTGWTYGKVQVWMRNK